MYTKVLMKKHQDYFKKLIPKYNCINKKSNEKM